MTVPYWFNCMLSVAIFLYIACAERKQSDIVYNITVHHELNQLTSSDHLVIHALVDPPPPRRNGHVLI